MYLHAMRKRALRLSGVGEFGYANNLSLIFDFLFELSIYPLLECTPPRLLLCGRSDVLRGTSLGASSFRGVFRKVYILR